MSDLRPGAQRTLLLRVMQWTGFGMRAAAVFLTSVVMFAAMIVIAHSLKMTSDVAPFRPASGRDLADGVAVEVDSGWQWPDTSIDLGPLRHVRTAPSEPVPVVTAAPVPDDTAIAAAAPAAGSDTTAPATSTDAQPDTTVIATPVPSGELGPAPERDPPPVAWPEPAPQPAPPDPDPASRPSPPAPDPSPSPSPQPTPSETSSDPASDTVDATTASESPTP
jgi:hypothetical protein